MRVFVTGATGFIGSAVVQELIEAGHQVTGLARTDAAAKRLAAMGARAHRGDIENRESLRTGAAASDGVIHTAFIHDIGHMSLSMRLRIIGRGLRHGMGIGFMSTIIETEQRAIEALGAALAGTGRPLVVAAGILGLKHTGLATENDDYDPNQISRRASEDATLSLVARGVRATVVRLAPSVHDTDKQGLVSYLIETARKKGVSAFVGDGANRWSAVHRLDAAHLFRLALEKGTAGCRYHGVTEEGIALRDIARVVGRRLNVPVESKSAKHFGFVEPFIAMDGSGSSTITQESLGWRPVHTTLLADLETGIKPG